MPNGWPHSGELITISDAQSNERDLHTLRRAFVEHTARCAHQT
jgi:hypothetical protein